jgi:hypothetical protein
VTRKGSKKPRKRRWKRRRLKRMGRKKRNTRASNTKTRIILICIIREGCSC